MPQTDKKRQKARLKLSKKSKNKNGIETFPDKEWSNFNPEIHAIAVANGGQKCGVDCTFLENKVQELFCVLEPNQDQLDLEILQPRDETFSIIRVNGACRGNASIFEAAQKPIIFNPEGQISQAPVLYFFLTEIANFKNFKKASQYPPGLFLYENFISEDLEQTIVDFVNNYEEKVTSSTVTNTNQLKNRFTIHFGHNFDYDVNGSTIKYSEDAYKIPTFLADIRKDHVEKDKSILMSKFDQVTINKYAIQGGCIPAHIDNTEAFDEEISAISLNADTVMEFKNKNNELDCYSVHLPRRSLLVMSKESRYDFTHAIINRKSDYINGQQVLRSQSSSSQPRISITYRKVKYLIPKLKLHKNLEDSHVKNVYDQIAEDFSRTRWNMWPKVEQFIKNLKNETFVADIGCGNGKYIDLLNNDNNREVFASDFSKNLIKVCKERNRKANSFIVSDCMNCPIRDNSFDAVISIAVIHHLTDFERRKGAISEIIRILRPGGLGLITVWARDQSEAVYADHEEDQKDQKDQKAHDNFENKECGQTLDIHKSRTAFKASDVLVPWKLEDKTYHRYYHIFKDMELESICGEIEGCEVVSNCLDNGNYCLIVQKSSS